MHVLKLALNRQKWVTSRLITRIRITNRQEHEEQNPPVVKEKMKSSSESIYSMKLKTTRASGALYIYWRIYFHPHIRHLEKYSLRWPLIGQSPPPKNLCHLIAVRSAQVCHRYQAEAFTLCLCNLEENKVCYRPVSFGKSCDIQKKDLPQTSNRGFLPQYLYSEEKQTCNRSVGFGMYC